MAVADLVLGAMHFGTRTTSRDAYALLDPIVGVSSMAQLDEALDAADLPLDDEMMRRLDEAG
ncbi:hypothetical protein [Calidifontibacter indicus]|uniref:Aldo/keto reductase family protein n=1 Tax=Calidifontibacter indicus TaxID=419650 RepID=A0A3D9UNC3_9MICO|nr:hypothetical protein [Calidifontibacter indicus]REF30942.1 aldo/keto reductase family protein [Calidifontibacter indicus]